MTFIKSTVGLLVSILLLAACATKTLVRYEEGEVVASRQNVRKTRQPEKYDVSFEKVGDGSHAMLKINVVKNKPIKEEWDDVYSRVGVYETRCKVYKNREDSQHKYCEFNSEWFWKIHGDLLGLPFLFDIFILPFWPYDERAVETKEPMDGTMSKPASSEISVESPIDAHSLKVTVGKTSATANFSDGSAQVAFSALKINPAKWSDDAKVSVDINGQHLDASAGFSAMIEKEQTEKAAREDARKIEQGKPQNKYKMDFCPEPNLYMLVFMSRQALKSNCIYAIGTAPLKVLQVTSGGVLVTSMEVSQYVLDKVIFIKTSKPYVDGDVIQNIYVKSLGPTSYTSVMGVGKTVNAFQYLGDFKTFGASEE